MSFDWKTAAPFVLLPFAGPFLGSFFTKESLQSWYDVSQKLFHLLFLWMLTICLHSFTKETESSWLETPQLVIWTREENVECFHGISKLLGNEISKHFQFLFSSGNCHSGLPRRRWLGGCGQNPSRALRFTTGLELGMDPSVFDGPQP